MSREITEVLRNQFNSSFYMLKILVDVCDDIIWYKYYHDYPFWYQVYHVTFYIEFWIRESYLESNFENVPMKFDIHPEFGTTIEKDISISRKTIQEWLTQIMEKTENFFDHLDDEMLGKPIFDGAQNFTYIDVVTCQNRHIMYNLGYLNGILRSEGMKESDWYSYNEKK